MTEIVRAQSPREQGGICGRAPVAQRVDQAPDGVIVVRAPYMGTFYRAPKPGAPVYVEVGSQVTTDTELCLVEVMKLFTAFARRWSVASTRCWPWTARWSKRISRCSN